MVHGEGAVHFVCADVVETAWDAGRCPIGVGHDGSTGVGHDGSTGVGHDGLVTPDLIGGLPYHRHDVVELFPVESSGLKEGKRTHDIGPGECERILDRTVHMGLGSKVDDAVDMFLLHEGVEGLEVADVHLHEPVVRPVFDVAKVGEVAGIGQLVYVDYLIIRVFVDEQPDNMGADESRSAGDYDGSFH